MRFTVIVILFTLLTYTLAFTIITFWKKFREYDDEFGPL